MPESSSLYTPQRQSPKAIVLILFKYFRIIVRQIWPILLVALINPMSQKGIYITYLVFAIAFLSLVYSIIAYTRFYFFIENDELCVRSGVFRKTVINVPFDRIQSVDFRRNVIHQLLNVVSVQVDTAGSKGSELELDAIEIGRAEELREIVLAYKKQKSIEVKTMVEGEDAVPPVPVVESKDLILSLSSYDLLKVGISENHIRTAGIIFFFFVSLADDLDQLLGINVYDQLENTTASFFGILATLIAIPLFIFISFMITLIRTVLKYYGLKFWSEGKRLKVVSGLFTRNEKSIQQSKIQLIRWITSPMKRLFGIYQMNIYQAANMEQQRDRSLAIPGCYKEQVDQTLDKIVPGFRTASFSSHKMHVRIVIVMVFLFGFLPAVGLGIMAWLNDGVMQWLLVLIFPLAVWMGALYQKKRRFKIHPDYILSEGGIFGNVNKLMEIHKVQCVLISSSPFQRRRGLSTLHIYTAGGDVTFPYLNENVACKARDYILYRVEKDHKSWM